jgi:ribosome-binding protein aMBF1 (putative translation factor)
MTSKEIKKGFREVLAFRSHDEKYEHDAQLLAAQFLSEIIIAMERKSLKKKDLAKMIGTSASYITQIFRGDKLINFITLAKIQTALKLKFTVNVEATATKAPSRRKHTLLKTRPSIPA